MYTLTTNINTSLGNYPTRQEAEDFADLLELRDYEVIEHTEHEAA